MKLDKFSEKINMDELYQRKNEIEQNRTKTYQKILSRVHTKIKVTSRQKTTEQFCFFIIPEFIIGLPRYDSATCTAYIIDKLLENGFQTKYTHPNLLFISWQHYIDKNNRYLFKKQHGYAIDGFGNRVKDKSLDKSNTGARIAIDPNSILTKRAIITDKKNEKVKVFKSIQSYKPTGALIYNKSLLETIKNGVTKE
jgi:hypothetical protein